MGLALVEYCTTIPGFIADLIGFIGYMLNIALVPLACRDCLEPSRRRTPIKICEEIQQQGYKVPSVLEGICIALEYVMLKSAKEKKDFSDPASLDLRGMCRLGEA